MLDKIKNFFKTKVEELPDGRLKFHDYKALKKYCDNVDNPLDKVVLGDDVTSLRELFLNSSRTNEQFAGIENWDVSKVKDMQAMFCNALSFNRDLGNWNVSKVVNMGHMFQCAENFNQDLSKWDMKSINYAYAMFEEADSFNYSNAPEYVKCFNRTNDLGVSEIDDLENGNKLFHTFQALKDYCDYSCNPLDKVVLSGEIKSLFDYDDKVMCERGLFEGSIRTNEQFAGIENWDVSGVKNLTLLFDNAKHFNRDLSNWDVSNVECMSGMFYGAKSFNQDLSSWKIKDYTKLDLPADYENKFKKSHNESSEIKSRSDCIYFDGNNRDKLLSKVGTYISEYGVWEVPVSVLTTENKDLIKKTAYRGFDEIEMQKSMSELEVAEFYIKNNEKQKEEKALHR